MRRFVARVAAGLVIALVVAHRFGVGASSAQVPQQPPPKFTAGVDVVEIDVSVLDKNHKPVRGLKAEDFTIREDSEPQKIVAFDEVYSAPPAPPSAPWMRDVPPDIETNAQAEHNMFVIIIDDALLTYTKPIPVRDVRDAPYKLAQTKRVARSVIQGLTDHDVAAVVLTNDGWSGANFTSDRSRLLRAVDRMTVGPIVDCPQPIGSAEALRAAVEALSSIPHVRKTVFYITAGGIGILGPDGCGNLYDAVQLAQRSNVNIYTVDPNGLRGKITDFDRMQIQTLQETADNTGGRAIINTNEPETHVAEVLDEARAYYLIGYQLTKRGDDNRFHRIEVTVSRPGVEVHTRSTRFEAKPETNPAKIPPPLEAAVGGFLPKADLRLAMSTATFAKPDGTARTEIGIAGQWPDPVPNRARDTMGVAIRVFTTDGRAVTSADQSMPVVLEPAGEQLATGAGPRGPTFVLSSEVALKPGAYSLRIGVHSTGTDKTGSVYSDIVVPDFKKDPLSLSGVLLTDSSGGSLRGDPLTTIEPTALRTFATDDRIQAFLRVYQGGTGAAVSASMHVRIVDQHNAAVVDRTEALPAQAFGADRAADYWLRLPLSSLKSGEYWLSIAATAGKATATRDVRFAVK